MFNLFSTENDSELDNIDVENSEIKNDETAVDAAAEKKEPTEVNISEEQSAHNEAASAGGCVVGDNEEQLSMDPIAAEESYIFERFGMSSEELDEAVNETIAEAEKIPEETETEDADLAATTVTDEPATTQNVDSEITVDSNATVPAAETTTEPAPAVEEPAASEEKTDDDDDEIDTPSTECLKMDRSEEKLFGYFSRKEFKNEKAKTDKNARKYRGFPDPKSFLTSDLGKSKIKDLKEDIKKKGLTPATISDCNELKSTFFNKWIRGADQETAQLKLKYYTVEGIVFATWHYIGGFSCIAMVKKNGKITSIGYAINVPRGVKESKESLDDIYAAALGL